MFFLKFLTCIGIPSGKKTKGSFYCFVALFMSLSNCYIYCYFYLYTYPITWRQVYSFGILTVVFVVIKCMQIMVSICPFLSDYLLHFTSNICYVVFHTCICMYNWAWLWECSPASSLEFAACASFTWYISLLALWCGLL